MFTIPAGPFSLSAWQPWLIPLADAAAKGVVLMLAIVLLAAAMRRASAARRHLAWSLGVAGLLVLPLLSAALPVWRVPLLPNWLAETVPVARPVVLPSNVMSHADSASERIEPQPGSWAADPHAMQATEASQAGAATRLDPNSNSLSDGSIGGAAWRSWLVWLVPVWLLGTVVCLLPPLAGLWQLARLRRGSTRVLDESWIHLLNALCGELDVRRGVQILRSSTASMPLTFGVWKPVLMIPAEADGWSPERRRLVLLHELAHVRRLDWLTQMLAHAACAVHWFNPLAWLAARQMHVEREQASDDLVLACGAKASDYARELLEIAANYHDRPLMALAAVPMARRSALEGRLRAVLDGRRNRAALTVMTGLVALSLLAAVLVPLAMLHAEDAKPRDAKPQDNKTVESKAKEEPRPKAEEPKKDDPKPETPATAAPAGSKPVAQRDPTPEEIEARTKGFRLSVLNAKGDKPIRAFRVIAGVRSSVSQEFEKRTGRDVVCWQPHTIRQGKDGDHVWLFAKAYDEMALRVEADGYIPQAWTWLKKAEGPKHLVFMLAEDPGIKGRVVQPDGRPAVGATVAIGLVQRDIRVENGRIWGADKPLPESISDRWRLPLFLKTDADGRFVMPTETDLAAVLVVHDSGVRELAYDDLKTSPEIKLEGWGRLEGRVLWKDKPGVDEPVSLTIHREKFGYPGMIAAYANTRSDADGRFVFEKVVPGLVQLSRTISVSDKPDSNKVSLNGMFSHVTVKAGEPTAVVLGGQGRTVTGKFTGRSSWDKVTFHVHPEAPHFGFGRDNDMWVAFGKFRQSPIGPLFFHDGLAVKANGSFTIENMLPGRYQLFLAVDRDRASTTIKIDPEVPGQVPPPMDLGVIVVKNFPEKPANAEAPVKPEVKPEAPAGEAANAPAGLSEFLGRVNSSQRGPFGGNAVAKNEQGEIIGLALAEFQLKPGDAQLIGQLQHLTWLSLQRSNVKDDDLRQWSTLKSLKKLNLWDAKITNAGIASLAGLTALQSLQLGGTGITDAGLASIAKLTALRELDLARTKVSDSGLNSLATLKQLEALKLSETSVSDAGLKSLNDLPKLRGITLDETAVTAAGIEALAKREGFGWMATSEGVAKELARRMTAGDAAGVEAMRSIALELPSKGKFKTRSVVALPVTDRDTERQRTRFRIEWDWNNNGKDEGLFAVIGVRQASVRVMEAGVLEAKAKPEAKAVTINGTAIDDETGKPVAPLITQGGMFDPANPAKIAWGFSEGRSSATDGSFSTTIRWGDGWTARILADGYLPYPLFEKAPPDDKNEISMVVRLKRGRLVRGQVLDHKDQPVKGAAVFANGPTGLNLAAGKAWSGWGGDDPVPKPAITDDAGRFELATGDAKSLAVSCSVMDLWPAAIPEKGDVTIRLPAPGRIDVKLDIEGAAKESKLFYQLLDQQPGFTGLRSVRELTIVNGGELSLPALPPGKYMLCRQVMNRLTEMGFGAMLDRQFVEIKSGETREIRMVREKGSRLQGKVTGPDGKKLEGIIVSVNGEKAEKGLDGQEWPTTFSSQTVAADGNFLTEKIPPGKYLLRAQGYLPLTPKQRVRSGFIGPSFRAEVRVEIPESGEVPDVELKLQ